VINLYSSHRSSQNGKAWQQDYTSQAGGYVFPLS